MIKTYDELVSYDDFLDRFEYLSLGGKVGEQTFGHNRWLNQHFYRSKEWRDFRRSIILRDKGFDLGVDDFGIPGKIIIHHLNPIKEEDILNHSSLLLDPQNVICVSHKTHEAIHYGDRTLLDVEPIIRRPNDTIPWR